MNAKRLALLVAVAVAVLGIAIALRTAHNAPAGNEGRDQPLLPALRDHVNDVSAITLTGPGAKVIATLSRGNGGWTIAERSGYPADITAIRALLVKLARATLVEAKTTNPQRYPEIGVDDVKDPQAKGVRLDLAGLAAPTSLIVGTYSVPARGTFVRRDGEAQSWLASGDLSVAKTVADWEKRDVVDIAADRVASITLAAPDGKALRLDKQKPGDAAFNVAEVPAGRKVDQGMASTVAATLSALRVDDAFPAKDLPPPDRPYKAEYGTFDGVTVHATAWTKEGKDYVQFRATFDRNAAQERIAAEQAKATNAQEPAGTATPATSEPTARQASDGGQQAPTKAPPASDPASARQASVDALSQEVDALNRTCSGWTYVVSTWVFGNLTKTVNDVLEPVKSKKPETPGPASH